MRYGLCFLLFSLTACQGGWTPSLSPKTAYQDYTGDRLLEGESRETEAEIIRAIFALPLGSEQTVEGLSVTVERSYQAASGYDCRRILLSAERRLICRKDDRLAVVNRI